MVKRLPSLRSGLNKVAGKIGKISRKFSRRPKKPIISTAGNSADKKKVLMFGWELPPFNSGGLGVACYELANSITKKNTDITFVLPRRQNINLSFMKVEFAEDGETDSYEKGNVSIKHIDTLLSPYLTEPKYQEELKKRRGWRFWKKHYGSDLMGEVYRYGDAAAKLARKEKFDVIHAHDWLSFLAGIRAKEVSKKPFIAHVHAIEYDRCHEVGVNPAICAIEKLGLERADKVIAVSSYTKERINKYYGIPKEKIEVVHNGINIPVNKARKKVSLSFLKSDDKQMVLFVGRITYQKGVDYLIKAAAEVIKYCPKAYFMIVGTGDMQHQIINEAASLGVSDRIFFPGFLRNADLDKIYRAADVYVMPSVSEPFGIVALEALSNGTPVIVSKQSGVAEVVDHALKVNFWEVDELANRIIGVLKHSALRKTLSQNGFENATRCTWDKAGEKCVSIYSNLAMT